MFDFLPCEKFNLSSNVFIEHVLETNVHTNDDVWEILLSDLAKKDLELLTDDEMDSNWKLDEYFETIYVINLPHSLERREKMIKELENIGTKQFEFFSAINGRKDLEPHIWKKIKSNLGIDINPKKITDEQKAALDYLHQGQAGCYMSHYKLIQQVKDAFDLAIQELEIAKAESDQDRILQAKRKVQKFSKVLILEDDGGFGILAKDGETVLKKNAGKYLRKALKNLPDAWDMLYFIINATEPTQKISNHLRRIYQSWSTLAYALNYTMYAPILELLKKIEDPLITQVFPIDVEYSEIHHLYKVYAVNPSIVFTQAGFSNITGKTWPAWQGQPIYPPKTK